MNPKIMKLRGELEKNKCKISDLQGRNRELEKQIREWEDTDIIGMVRENGMTCLLYTSNNLNDMDTWIFFKWAFKSAAAVLIVTTTWTIVMGVFDAAQSVVASASGLIIGCLLYTSQRDQSR